MNARIVTLYTAALLGLVGPAQAQVVITATLPGTSLPNQAGPMLATSSSFNLYGGNAVALIVTAERAATTEEFTALFAGQPMTLGVATNEGVQWAGIFYLLNPAIKTGQFEITSSTNLASGDYAYSAIALANVAGVADTDARRSTSTDTTALFPVSYTLATNGGFVLAAFANNATSTANDPEFVSGSANQATLASAVVDSSGHLHAYGAVSVAGPATDNYRGQYQRSALATLAFETSAPGTVANSFGFIDSGTEFVVDTGAGLVFKVTKSNGSVVSWVYNGVDYKSASGSNSHLISGLGGTGTAVTATNTGDVIMITTQTDTNNGVVQELTHYLIVSNGVNNVYMATFPKFEPGVGELRWITRLNHGLLPNGPAPSNLSGNTGAIESGDVFGIADGTTRSKYYGDNLTHGKDRAMDMTYCGASGTGVGVWMVYSSRESSSGGPFYRDIQNQAGTDMEIYNYLNSGHGKIEAWRHNVLYGPYALVWTDGATPTLPLETEWIGALGLTGWVGASGRGSVSGTATGIQAGIAGVVGLKNTTAQYWTRITNSNFTVSGVKPGVYTATLYQGELEVATGIVSVSAGNTTALNLASTWSNPSTVFKIGEWDGTPQGFLNATNILGFAIPNFITMHPQDVRMDPWGANSNVFNVGTDPISVFPSICMRGTNGNTYIHFNLTAGQITNLTLRIGATVSDNGGRPSVAIFNPTYPGGKSYGFPAAPPQAEGRTWTLGTYRGFNLQWTWSLPAADLVVGQNTLRFSPVSGSADISPWLSAGWVYDCVQLDGPSGINMNPPVLLANYSGNQLNLSWPDHAGWTLQMQTNSLTTGLGTNWVDLPGSTSITSTNITVDPTKPVVFYRLKL